MLLSLMCFQNSQRTWLCAGSFYLRLNTAWYCIYLLYYIYPPFSIFNLFELFPKRFECVVWYFSTQVIAVLRHVKHVLSHVVMSRDWYWTPDIHADTFLYVLWNYFPTFWIVNTYLWKYISYSTDIRFIFKIDPIIEVNEHISVFVLNLADSLPCVQVDAIKYFILVFLK